MKLTRLFGLTAAAAAVFLTGCSDTTKPEPPPPPPPIPHGIHYAKTFDSTGRQNGLQNDDVYAFVVRPDETVWIGNQSGVATFPNLTTNTRVPNDLGDPGDPGDDVYTGYDETSGMSNPKVRDMVELNGFIYVATWGGGVSVFNLADSTWSTLRQSDDELTDDHVASIEVDGGRLYFATNNGVSVYDPGTDTWSRFQTDPNENVVGDLLDPLVSVIRVSDTPRGKEFFYAPRVEFRLEPGEEDDHGITITRGTFDASPRTTSIAAVRDNTLYEDAAGALSNGQGEYIFAGVGRDGLERRAVIDFDLAGQLTKGAKIRSVRLRVRADGGIAWASGVAVHRGLADWGEGTSQAGGDESAGAPAENGDATWLHTFYSGSTWRMPGGDFDEVNSAQRLINADDFFEISSTRLNDDVLGWHLDPSTDHGWTLVGLDSLKRFASVQSPNPSWRPTLLVTYREYSYVTVVSSNMAEPNINDVLYDDVDDLYYVCFATRGIGVMDVAASSWRYFTMDHGLPSNAVFSIARVGNDLWVATQRGIAVQTGPNTWQGFGRGAGLKSDQVRRVFTDDGTRLWLAYVQAGAGRVDAAAVR